MKAWRGREERGNKTRDWNRQKGERKRKLSIENGWQNGREDEMGRGAGGRGGGEWGERTKVIILRLVSVRIYTRLILSFEILIITSYLLSFENVN